MYPRTLSQVILRTDKSFPVLLVTGPRQVGKTTLLEMCAGPERQYITLDDPEKRALAQNDPGLFIQTFKPPVIIDEIQYAPGLFSHIKQIVDREKKNGLYWLTGSQKFHLMRGITESLAGRVAILDLLGFSQAETERRGIVSRPFLPVPTWVTDATKNIPAPARLMEVYERIWLGSFPRVHANPVSERDIFYRSYVQTYLQRDVKDILAVSDMTAFHAFLGAVAARTGQLLNYAGLARDVGIDVKTSKAWLSVLETSGLVYLLFPWFTNLSKRLVKAPKLYFLDTGLCSYLTKWPSAASLEAGALSGAILETWIFSEILKSWWHNGAEPHFHYYRDLDQKEIDLLIETGDTLHPVEFKKTGTPSRHVPRHFQVLNRLGKKVGTGAVLCFVEEPVPLFADVTAIPVGYL